MKQYYIYSHNFIKIPGVVYFVSEEIAKRALNEIVLPFNRGELEVCKIWEE